MNKNNQEMVLVNTTDALVADMIMAGKMPDDATLAKSGRDAKASLFLYSGLVDQLRDSAFEFYKSGNAVSAFTVSAMTEQYNRYRNALVEVLFPIVGMETLDKTCGLSVSSTSVDAIYQACAQLSRWCDLVHQMPNFLIAQEIQSATAEKLRSETAQQIAAAPQEPNLKQIGFHPGAYL